MAPYNSCQGLVPGRSLVVEKHWSKSHICTVTILSIYFDANQWFVPESHSIHSLIPPNSDCVCWTNTAATVGDALCRLGSPLYRAVDGCNGAWTPYQHVLQVAGILHKGHNHVHDVQQWFLLSTMWRGIRISLKWSLGNILREKGHCCDETA